MALVKTFLYCLLAAGCLQYSVAAISDPATPISVHLPAQPLRDALNGLARQTGLQVLFETDEVSEALRAPPVEGVMTAQEVLERLLSNTALEYRFVNPRIISVYRSSPDAAGADPSRGTLPAAASSAERIASVGSERLAQVDKSVLGAASGQGADSAEKARADGSLTVEEVTVTGTRIKRAGNGYDQPTPVTAIAAQALQSAAPTNFADALNQLPQFLGSVTGNGCCGAGSPGNFLNLRALGTNRLLVLLDGDRLTPTRETGDIDVNLLPELLVERIDVVTGGASAAYGSDAVSGVVNYVINKRFEGVKFVAQTGLSGHGDDKSVKAGLAGGAAFAGDRGHFVASFEHFDSDGITSLADRPSLYAGHFLAGNGTAATPYNVVVGARNVIATTGGVIVNEGNLPVATAANPLAGLKFEPGGATSNFALGTPLAGSPSARLGGDGYVYGPVSALAALRTEKLYTRFGFDLNDSLTAFVRLNAAETHTFQQALENGQRGATSFTIFRENAFLPAAVAAQMDGAGISSFRLGRQENDFGMITNDYETKTYDASVGLEGTLSGSWTWQATYSKGQTRVDGEFGHDAILDNLYAAADAVVNPATGQVVCRVTLTNPGVFPGCAPINLFGNGAPSQAALDYVTGTVPQLIKNAKNLAAVSLQGDLFSLPAGMVTAAIGAEYREDKLLSVTDALTSDRLQATGVRGFPTSLCPTVTTCRFGRLNQAAAFGPADADTNVTEGFVEALVPLLRNLRAVKSLDLNGAYRYTDYKTSGGVNTWKVGLTYEPIGGLRLRGTRSRDIRAPNVFELFAGAVVNQDSGILDPATGQFFAFVPTIRQGNPGLVPEEADTTTFGIVYQPSWLQGFSGSVDYYDIDIGGALSSTDARSTLSNCQAGDTEACARVTRDGSGNLQQVILTQINLNSRRTSGIDIDLSYNGELGPGSFGLRGLFTRIFDYTDTVGGVSRQLAGYNGTIVGLLPHWRGNLDLTYDVGNFSVFLQERYIGKNLRGNGRDVYLDPEIRSVFYTDVSATWKLGPENQYELYGTVNNLFDRKGPLTPTNTNPGFPSPILYPYDYVGTYFTIGARANF
jgi:outer membrane receptor protein involved in Fe transport